MLLIKDSAQRTVPEPLSLSTYYPASTQYFYGYPAGDDSGFLNNVPPEIEELVSMRAISCAGPSVSVISYAATNAPDIDRDLWIRLNLPRIDRRQILALPAEITPELQGGARNEAIKQALKSVARDHSLVMAQPYMSRRLAHAYQIPPDITAWINDKNNLQKLIAKKYVPERLATFLNGRAFFDNYKSAAIDTHVVVKVASSSSGDGVYICRSRKDLDKAAAAVKEVSAPVLVERYVKAVRNYGLHFGIPYDDSRPIDIIGVNEQMTSESGEFEGGIIRSLEVPGELKQVKHYIEYACLPKVRKMGWYGIGCFDVLIGKDGACYIVDSNFRMTGMSAYHFMAANGQVKPPLIGFGGSFKGSRRQFEEAITPFISPRPGTSGSGTSSLSGRPVLQLIALNEHGNIWRFNAALMFDDETELIERCRQLTRAGIRSELLERCLTSQYIL